jgi:ACS family hexuronate transporter-like MFS transporter
VAPRDPKGGAAPPLGDPAKRTRSRVRWVIGSLLFASTVINYVDRQTISALAPILKAQYHWSNSDFASLLISFRIGYTIMQAVGGRLLDVVGSRLGFALVVSYYSLIAMATSLAGGLGSFRCFRFLLGLGEGPNMPGAAKTVAEWFPGRERAMAVALFDSGSSIGGAVAPFVALYAYKLFGSWRPAFVLTGSLGFLWLIGWLRYYRSPERHPAVSADELQYIREGRETNVIQAPAARWRDLIGYRQTWGIVLGRFLLDPFWFFISEWFALYLLSKGYRLEASVLGFWMPFLGADIGNFVGGGISSYWVSKGWPVGKARRGVLLIFGPSMGLLILTLYTRNYFAALGLFAFAAFSYAACSTIFTSLPTDVFHHRAVGTVSGMAGTGAGIGTMISTYLIGRVTDSSSFAPVIAAAAIIPLVATAVFVTMVRPSKHPDPKGLLLKF